jgi:hypothetical protein
MQKETESINSFVVNTTGPLPGNTLQKFREELESFVFFHLGSDTDVEERSSETGLLVSVQHQRVHPFSFRLSYQQIAALINSPDGLEKFLMQKMSESRKS